MQVREPQIDVNDDTSWAACGETCCCFLSTRESSRPLMSATNDLIHQAARKKAQPPAIACLVSLRIAPKHCSNRRLRRYYGFAGLRLMDVNHASLVE